MLKFQSNILRSLTRFWWQPLSHDGVFKEHTDEKKKKKMHYINFFNLQEVLQYHLYCPSSSFPCHSSEIELGNC